MTEPFPLHSYRAGMEQITATVFETILALPVNTTNDLYGSHSSWFTGAVYYAGEWQGALMVECSREQAMDWAARFMSLTPPVNVDDARDGLGELTNIIAGNLKPLLPTGVGLSIPSVVQGSDYCLRICGGNLSETLCFQDSLGPFRVTLVEVIG
jgi:chemotaxis protein CheX